MHIEGIGRRNRNDPALWQATALQMSELDSSWRSDLGLKLDTTVLLPPDKGGGQGHQHKCPLFALVSLNDGSAPSAEVPWSQLLTLSLTPDDALPVLSVGRSKDCSVQLTDPRVSQVHFEVVARRRRAEGDIEGLVYECRLKDCSSNGTTINGVVVGKGSTELLRSGDEIVVLPSSRVGDESSISFLFRNTTEVLRASPEVKELELEEHVLCPICMQAIYKCVALLPCLHNFCMSCYSEWMLRKDDCPVCRQLVTAVVKNHPMDAVVGAFLEAYPEKCRSQEELKDLDRRDRLRLGNGGKVVRDTASVGTSTRPQAQDANSGGSSARERSGSVSCSLQ